MRRIEGLSFEQAIGMLKAGLPVHRGGLSLCWIDGRIAAFNDGFRVDDAGRNLFADQEQGGLNHDDVLAADWVVEIE